ncbi:polyprenol phosphomannose-dependent alpha 1,6 mannosyltransferase MptB [Parenemella sanctibonifatiensis]|uniref:DUF2029 domain-containing protein n=1 Tax=Parenemella sanctibonifatiensis TaxID=2016505 RepID=A0A255EMJ9_9ACTN|nr:polyprenol phosphomannose-dependent alpha 1,6 mannosyltransferase MptB [Parenemella sanctibonifatiensis]OYN85853.1 hypothetical protein CGZ92_10205 [Parenemella sanctibonifatiensis]OYN92736.1 hypothetical protein CGZ91_04540 [Parenemella sanctibonifatiensis]
MSETDRDATTFRASDQPWHRNPWVGMGGIVLASVITIAIAFSGPSAAAINPGPRHNLLPPWYLPGGWVDVNQWTASILLWSMIAIAGVALVVALRAMKAGWRPRPWRIFGLGALLNIATSLTLPLTSADVLMYAAYGRLQVLGIDPYQITPAEIFRQQYDPVLRWTERPWQDTPSVYGPIASFTQWLANILGGESMHNIVFWLQMFGLIPLLVTCFIVVWLVRHDAQRAARASLLTIANPLLIWALTAGAHNEALSVVFAVAGIAFMRRGRWGALLAGVGIGLAGLVKVSLVFYGIAMLWGYRREPVKAGLVILGAAIPMGVGYLLISPGSLFASLRNAGYVSSGSWASYFLHWLTVMMGNPASKVVISVISYSAMVVLAWIFFQIIPRQQLPAPPRGPSRAVALELSGKPDPIAVTLRTALVLCAAWLLTSPYSLPWYDLLIWVPMGMLAATRLDVLVSVRVVFLSMAYATSRDLGWMSQVDWATQRIRDLASPAVQIGVVVAIVLWWHQEWLAKPTAERPYPLAWLRRRALRMQARLDRERAEAEPTDTPSETSEGQRTDPTPAEAGSGR